MKNMPFAISMLALSLVLASIAAKAADGPVELMCRNKAKEIAIQSFQNCVTDEKTTRLKDIKQRYKERMAELKNEFQQQLDDLNGKKNAAKEANKSEAKPVELKTDAKPEAKAEPKPAKIKKSAARAERPTSGVAKSLPQKQNDNGPAIPMQQASDDDQPVVTLVPVATVEKTDIPAADEAPSDEPRD